MVKPTHLSLGKNKAIDQSFTQMKIEHVYKIQNSMVKKHQLTQEISEAKNVFSMWLLFTVK